MAEQAAKVRMGSISSRSDIDNMVAPVSDDSTEQNLLPSSFQPNPIAASM